MTVVADSSVIIVLWRVQRLNLLHQLFGEVVIPAAVATEISVQGKPGSTLLSETDWIKPASLFDITLADRFISGAEGMPRLDIGESEAIALALELKANALLVDDRQGRMVAKQMGIRVIGVVGILLLAKRVGLISEIRPVLDALVEDVGFRLNRRLYQHTLELADEV